MASRIIKIERKKDLSLGWILSATSECGFVQVFGHMMTERGSKRMLTSRAKQFGLKVNGDIAE